MVFGVGIWEEGIFFPLAFSIALNTTLWRQGRISHFLTAFSGYRFYGDVLKNEGIPAVSPLSIKQASFHENLSKYPELGNREANRYSQASCNGFY